MTPLDRAKDLVEGLDERRDRRLERGDIGAWQTEINEVARVLHYLIAHMEASDADSSPP